MPSGRTRLPDGTSRAQGNGPNDTPLLRIRGLGMRYDTATALHALDLDVLNGEFLTILGPSGSGKTTLLRLIAGFLVPSSGRIELEGRDIAGLPINQRPFNTVFQDYALFPHLKVRDNVAFGLRVRGTPSHESRKRVDAALATVELSDLADRYPSELSGGQQQRTALARAMICEPQLILLDEPLAALDASLRRQMQNFLKSVQRRSGITFLFVTHDQSEAITMSDRICVMNDGRIQQLGPPRTLYYQPANRFVASFFGENNLLEPCELLSSDGTTARVRTPLGEVRVAGKAPGCGRLALAIRPEALTLAGADALNRLEGTVASLTFVGSETIAEIALAQGAALTMKIRSEAGDRGLAIGQAVALDFTPDAAALIELDAR